MDRGGCRAHALDEMLEVADLLVHQPSHERSPPWRRISPPASPYWAFSAREGLHNVGCADERRVPAYRTPEPAAIALAHALRYSDLACTTS
jgi:hypothetical protein